MTSATHKKVTVISYSPVTGTVKLVNTTLREMTELQPFDIESKLQELEEEKNEEGYASRAPETEEIEANGAIDLDGNADGYEVIKAEEFITVPDARTYHLSDVNLLSGRHSIPKEDLEITHTHAEHQVVRNLAMQIFSDWDLSNDGIISVDEIIDSGLDRQFAEALGRVMDCDKSGQIVCEGTSINF